MGPNDRGWGEGEGEEDTGSMSGSDSRSHVSSTRSNTSSRNRHISWQQQQQITVQTSYPNHASAQRRPRTVEDLPPAPQLHAHVSLPSSRPESRASVTATPLPMPPHSDMMVGWGDDVTMSMNLHAFNQCSPSRSRGGMDVEYVETPTPMADQMYDDDEWRYDDEGDDRGDESDVADSLQVRRSRPGSRMTQLREDREEDEQSGTWTTDTSERSQLLPPHQRPSGPPSPNRSHRSQPSVSSMSSYASSNTSFPSSASQFAAPIPPPTAPFSSSHSSCRRLLHQLCGCFIKPFDARKKELDGLDGAVRRRDEDDALSAANVCGAAAFTWSDRLRHRCCPNAKHPALLFLFRPISIIVILLAICIFAGVALRHTGMVPTALQPELPETPFTIISLLRDMSDQMWVNDKATAVIQWTALLSWTQVVPPSRIIIFMDTRTSCENIMRQPELLGLRCLVVPCWQPEYERPMLDCIFNAAHAASDTDLIAYVNGDIVLDPDLGTIVTQVSHWFPQFMLVSRRTDTLLPGKWIDEYRRAPISSNMDSPGRATTTVHPTTYQVKHVLDLAKQHGEIHSEFGIDLFVYSKRVFAQLDFPPFLAGVYRWDNWLLSRLILRPDVAVVDGTRHGLVVHQELGKVSHQGRKGAPWNDGIAKRRGGLSYKVGNINNADYVLDYANEEVKEAEEPTHGGSHKPLPAVRSQWNRRGVSFTLRSNTRASVEVLIAKLVSPSGWLAVLPLTHFDVESGAMDNWLCWAQRQNVSSFIFLAADQTAARAVRQRGVHVLAFDDGPERSAFDPTLYMGDGIWSLDAAVSASSPDSPVPPHTLPSSLHAISTFDFLMFRTEFLRLVLRCGYNFLWSSVHDLWLEDPLPFLAASHELLNPYGESEWSAEKEQRIVQARLPDTAGVDDGKIDPKAPTPFDVQGVGNATWLEPRFVAVRGSKMGQVLWQAVYVCEGKNGEALHDYLKQAASGTPPRPTDNDKPPPTGPPLVDCLNDSIKRLKKKLNRHALSPLLFPSYELFFRQQEVQMRGVLPIVIRDDQDLTLLSAAHLDASIMQNASDGAKNMGAGLGVEDWIELQAAQHVMDTDMLSIDPTAISTLIQQYKRNQVRRWKRWSLLANDLHHLSSAHDDGPVSMGCIELAQPMRASPISKEVWDAYEKSRGQPQPLLSPPPSSNGADDDGELDSASFLPSSLDFRLKIRILTFNRPRSLARLLDSLNHVRWHGARIDIDVSIDHPNAESMAADDEDVARWRAVKAVSAAFRWKHGVYSVLEQETNIGLVGQWTWGWPKPDIERRELLLVLEDDTSLVPASWEFLKAAVEHFYLNPHNYDPNCFGLSLQTQHTVLGESTKWRYGSRKVYQMLPPNLHIYRYQLLGTWGTLFFPEQWATFTKWLAQRRFQPRTGTSAVGFRPCVPNALSNQWWGDNPRRVWSQWFARFAYEKGWYGLYTNFHNQSSLVVNYREGGLNFKETRGAMNPAVEELLPEYINFPPMDSLPLFDFNFRDQSKKRSRLLTSPYVQGATMPHIHHVQHASSNDPPQPFSLHTSPGWLDECYTLQKFKPTAAMREEGKKRLQEKLDLLETRRKKLMGIQDPPKPTTDKKKQHKPKDKPNPKDKDKEKKKK